MIPITYFRSSSYNCHDMCHTKFIGEYTLGWNGPSNMKADKGTMVHKVLEQIAMAKYAHQEGKQWVKDEITRFKVHPEEVVTAKKIDDLVDRVFNYYAKAFSHHAWNDDDLKEIRKWTWKALDFRDGAFDPRLRDIVATEPHFDIEIKEPWAFYSYELSGEKLEGFLSIKGTIDLITQVEDGVYEIVDWKTGRRVNWATGEEYTLERLRKAAQLRIYHYAVHYLYPEVEQVMVTINYINNGGPYTICYDKEDLPKTIEMIKQKFEKIRSTDIPDLIKRDRRWVCRKFCDLGMSTFEGTDVTPLVQQEYGHVTSPGEFMSKCEQIRYTLKHRSIDSVTKHMSSPGHNLAAYKAPGEVK